MLSKSEELGVIKYHTILDLVSDTGYLIIFTLPFTNKASEGDRIPVELFQILKDDAMKVLHSCLKMTLPFDRSNLDKLPPINIF